MRLYFHNVDLVSWISSISNAGHLPQAPDTEPTVNSMRIGFSIQGEWH